MSRRSVVRQEGDAPASVPTRRGREALATFRSFTYTVCHFLEVAIHQIVFNRDIYPRDFFHSTNNYNLGTQTCRHPQVIKWIRDAVMAVSEELLKNSIKRIAVVILSPNDQPLERFIFDMSSFPSIPQDKHDVPMLQPGTDMSSPGQELVNLEREFQSCLIKLKYSNTGLGKIPEDSTFGLAIELNDDQAAPNNYTDTWMPCEKQEITKHLGSAVAPALHCARTTSVRSVELGAFCMSLWIEETKVKSKLAV